MPATWKKLAYADEVPALTLFSAAHMMLASNAANVAVGVTLAANEMVGRLAGANIANLTAANVRTIINVEDGAQACNAVRVAAAGAVMESDYAANGDLAYASAANTVSMLPIGANGEVLKVVALQPSWEAESGGIAFPETANAATRAATTGVLGQGIFQVDTLEAYVCTVAG
jgi:hypothetical protein